MVRLDRITLNNFKSFAGRITIPFPAGFNAVAGANGSGKSNIIDALTFVLGTKSARSIRAQKLKNLIFNGGRDRKPAEFCEVSIYLDNKDGKIPGEEEIKITRRITRSGISIYKIGGRTVTRSKILDILSYASLSPDGYNIIMQGDVTRIIEMSPMERREIIDDISGISEFDDKKQKAGAELQKVETRVRENMIVVAEKQRLVARLKEEKENAERYHELDKKLRQAKASLIKKRLDGAEEAMEKITAEIEESSSSFEEKEKGFEEIEKKLESIEKEVREKSEQLIQKSRNVEIIRQIDSLKTNILRKKDRIDTNERDIERLRMTAENRAVKEILALKKDGIFGTLSSLISVPQKYSTAIDVALGGHASDIVVRDDDIAAFCIKHLKQKKIGRVRFLPINRMRGKKRKPYKGKDVIGYAIDLVDFDKKYLKAVEYVLENTLIVKNIDVARKIDGFRIVTLDGDLVEVSGAMIGGIYTKRRASHGKEIAAIEEKNKEMEKEIQEAEKKLKELESKQEEETEEVKHLEETRTKEKKEIEEMHAERKKLYEERLVIQESINKKRVSKAKLEAKVDNLRTDFKEFKDVTKFLDKPEEELQEMTRQTIIDINSLGPVNMKAIEEFQTFNVEFEELRKKLDRLLEEKEAVTKVVTEIETKRKDKFMETFTNINENFSRIYSDMTGGTGDLRLEEEGNIDSGLIIEASPSGKKILNLDSMSGGEKTMASLTFLFAIMQHYASPFYVLDEIDAALDKANTKKVATLIKKYSKEVQFIVITHNDFTIQESDKVFGVSMERGASRIFGVDLERG